MGKLYKSTDLIPHAGKYRCIVCGLVVDITEHMIANGLTFFTCPVCRAGEIDGPKGVHEEFRLELD